MRPVRDIKIKKNQTVKNLIKQFSNSGGFSSKLLSDGAKILREMVKDRDCTKFLSFPGNIIATGTRGVIRDLIKKKFFDVIVTTCGAIDHDLARIWKNYYHGTFFVDDKNLHRMGINRLGNVFIPNESYGIILEKKIQPLLKKIYNKRREISTKELIWELGEEVKREKNAKSSILYWAWKNKIPIFVPGIFDGAFGSQIWLFSQINKDFRINLLKDENDLSEIIYSSKRTGALILGGGISKHHVIWWNQFKDGLDYAIQITTGVEWDGSLSGARIREAISWGKVKEGAKKITIPGDITILLPLLVSFIQI